MESQVKNNPYVALVHQYPQYILACPRPEVLQERINPHLFQNQPVQIDIGCGAGEYLVGLRNQDPQGYLFGFEIRYKRLVLAARKFEKRHLENILLLKEQGELLPEYFQPASIDAIYINFPDPWFKTRHQKHRLLGESFLENVALLLKPHGFLALKTDHAEYFQFAQDSVSALPEYQFLEHTTDLYQSPFVEKNIPTEFESLFRRKLQAPIYYFKIGRSDFNPSYSSSPSLSESKS